MNGAYKKNYLSEESDAGKLPYYPGTAKYGHSLRIRRAFRQFMKYSVVGASGFVLNLLVYSIMVKGAGVHYMIAASVSFAVAVTNNFILNKYWTFGNPDGAVSTQARRFLVVSVISLLINLMILRMLMEFMQGINMPGIYVDKEIVAQSIAIFICTVLNFTGNKLWSFRNTAAA